MKIYEADRETLRDRVKKLIPQIEKSEIVNHFVKERIAQSTIYATINRMETTQLISDKKKTECPSFRTTPKKAKCKRLINNSTGVSQRALRRKFGVRPITIGRQIAKLGITYRKRDKTHKYSKFQ